MLPGLRTVVLSISQEGQSLRINIPQTMAPALHIFCSVGQAVNRSSIGSVKTFWKTFRSGWQPLSQFGSGFLITQAFNLQPNRWFLLIWTAVTTFQKNLPDVIGITDAL